MAARVFISYRRDDTAPWVDRIYEHLARDISRSQLFMDIDDIAPGADFVRVLEQQVAAADVLLCVIGQNWLEARDERGGRRLDDPLDFVRIEVASGLKNPAIQVIPLLIQGASMPDEAALPDDLKVLTRRNAVAVTRSGFPADMDRVLAAVKGRPTVWRAINAQTLWIAAMLLTVSVPPMLVAWIDVKPSKAVTAVVVTLMSVNLLGLMRCGLNGMFGRWWSAISVALVAAWGIFGGILIAADFLADQGVFDVLVVGIAALGAGITTFIVLAKLFIRAGARSDPAPRASGDT